MFDQWRRIDVVELRRWRKDREEEGQQLHSIEAHLKVTDILRLPETDKGHES